ncbi:MAG: 2OG-Fe(II) oxygenase [Sphingomonas sp.]|nr:2OG-Fe(II) oxygenase [Sphingomonas sp.]
MVRELFTLNPNLDRAELAAAFARDGRVQVRDLLTSETAKEVFEILATQTPWGIAWHSDAAEGPQAIEAPELYAGAQEKQNEIGQATYRSAAKGDYAFQFARYSIVEAYLGKWREGGPHDLLLEYINAPDFLDFIREVTGMPELIKADAQATLFAPGHFLGRHSDSHMAEGWKVAYVMNFCRPDWHPDWGGYLNFYDEDGDIVAGYRPRPNALNLFAVPRAHAVSFVPPYAPVGRFAITGWFRDR